jgi:membrane fusion protein, multidrug efflux system
METVSPETSKMPTRRKFFLIGLAVVILVAAIWRLFTYLTHDRYMESTDNAYVEADISAVAPKVQGYVRTVAVQDNQKVRKGDVLVVIDDSEYQAKLVQAQAAVATRRAAIDNVQATADKQRSAIAAALSGIDAKRAESQRASSDLQRLDQLLKDQWISKQRWQSAKADAQKSTADVTSATAEFNSQKSQLSVLSSQAKVVLSSYRESLAALETAQLDVDNTVLRAPIDGVIGNRAVRVGQYVRAGTLLVAVVPLSDVYVSANFKETQLGKIRIGQSVDLHVDAYPDQKVTGIVDSISPASGSRFSILPAENATGNFTKIVQRVSVKIRLADKLPDGIRLTPGMSVEASVDTRTAPAARR